MAHASTSLLSEPLTIAGRPCRNRVVMPPVVTVRDPVSAEGVSWYGEHAAGGPGLVIIEATGVPRFGEDITVATLRPLVDAIHDGGALAAIQLFPVHFGSDAEVDTTSLAGIAAIVNQYRVAARICAEAGMDGVEPHGAHGYLLNRFFSPAENHRTDEYGGSLENRMRLGLGLVRAVVEEVGPELFVLYRHSPVQEESYGLEDSLPFARRLVDAGVAVLDISPSSDRGLADLAAPFMGLGAAVIAVGSMDEAGRAHEALGQGRCDLVAVGRGLIADPQWPLKVQAGQWDCVVKCTKCNTKCFGNLKKGVPIACTQWT